MPSAGEPPSHTARCAATLPELHGAAVGAPDARRACLRRRGRPRGFSRLRSPPATRGLARRRYRSSTAPASVRPPLAAQAPRAWLEAAGSHGCSRDCAARRRVHKPAGPLYLGRSPESHRSLRGDPTGTPPRRRAPTTRRPGPSGVVGGRGIARLFARLRSPPARAQAGKAPIPRQVTRVTPLAARRWELHRRRRSRGGRLPGGAQASPAFARSKGCSSDWAA